MILDVNSLIKIFFPILIAFSSSRLIFQTDLIMISMLGENAVGAYSVPMRVMFFDMIVAMAIGPIVSISISESPTQKERYIILRNAISLAVYLGIILMGVGLIVYPLVVDAMISSYSVAMLAKDAVFYLTLAIPIRLTQFVGLMLLYGSGRGKEITPYILGSVILNAVLNWVLIYHYQLGFKGCYISTVITSFIELVITLWLLSKECSLYSCFRLPDIVWFRSVFDNIGLEWGRLTSFHLVNLVMLGMFSTHEEWGSRLGVFSVAMEFQSFLFMPMIAMMRSVAIALADKKESLPSGKQVYRALGKVSLAGLVLVIFIAAVLVLFAVSIGYDLYHFSGESMQWWFPFMIITSMILPIYYINSLQLGAWQARGKFGCIFMVEGVTQWTLLLPIMYIGLEVGNAWVSWSGLLIVEIVTAVVLFLLRDRLNLECENDNPISHTELEMT